MRNIYIDILAIILVASSTCMAATTVAPRTDESQTSHPPLCSRAAITSPRISQPLEQKTARPAAKIYADHCSSADLAALGGNDLINYLQTHSRDCLADVLWIFDDNMPAIFTNQNMQTVLKAIEALVPTYDGTNATGLHQLWFFGSNWVLPCFLRKRDSIVQRRDDPRPCLRIESLRGQRPLL